MLVLCFSIYFYLCSFNYRLVLLFIFYFFVFARARWAYLFWFLRFIVMVMIIFNPILFFNVKVPLFFYVFNSFVSLSNINTKSCVLLHFTDTCGDYTGPLNISNMVSGT